MKSRLPEGFKSQSMNSVIESAKRVQVEMAAAEEKIAEMEFCAVSGGGVVEVTVSGDKKVKEVKISKEIVEDIEMLQDMIIVATNSALEKASDYHDKKISAITGNLSIPGL
ncbi:MAG: YbaB/EbfC family nucleoid-associated protein [Oscillospiraceae bacterium]|jgi:DNA-binding YbaB/EbfC family protein|nr:YbaB/EbfC family nucleoid-associated protein [Oscillospiraceae bacterium]